MIVRLLLATSAVGLVLASAAQAQIDLPPAPPTAAPPVSPTEPSQRPEDFGQLLQRGQSVTERPRPEYDPLGLRLGSFFLYPKLEADELYNDNVFATKTNTKDDFVTVVSPTLDLRSNWGVHELDLRAGASVGTYAKQSSENYGDYFAAAQGRYDVSATFAGLAGLKYEHLHEERDSPDAPGGAANPVEFDAYTGTLGLTQHGLRIGYLASFDFRREDYQNVAAIGGGTINEKVRNVNVYAPSLRVSYEFAPRYEAFARVSGNIRDYDNSTGGVAGVPDRNSSGYRADVGATIDLTGITYAEVYAGYLNQDYRSSALGSIGGLDFGARIVWNVTELTSISLNGQRQVQDENTIALNSQGLSANSPGYLRSTVALAIDHELLRNLLLHGEVDYENDDYKGIDRTDDRFDVGAGLRYLFTRNFYLGGSYTYTNHSSAGTSATGQFSRDLFLLRLGAQL